MVGRDCHPSTLEAEEAERWLRDIPGYTVISRSTWAVEWDPALNSQLELCILSTVMTAPLRANVWDVFQVTRAASCLWQKFMTSFQPISDLPCWVSIKQSKLTFNESRILLSDLGDRKNRHSSGPLCTGSRQAVCWRFGPPMMPNQFPLSFVQ